MHLVRKSIIITALLLVGSFSTPRTAEGEVTFSVTISDPQNVGTAYHDVLEANLIAAGNAWAEHIDGNATIEIELQFDSIDGVLMYAGASTSVFQNQSGGFAVYDWGTTSEIRTGNDPNGASPDAIVAVNPDFFDSFYFDPNPGSGTANVPSNKYDAYSVFVHELGHALTFNGWLEDDSGAGTPVELDDDGNPIPVNRPRRVYTCEASGAIKCSQGGPLQGALAPSSNYMSVYDTKVQNNANGTVSFTGAASTALVSGGIGLDPESYAHLASSNSVMHTYAFPGTRESVTAIELAIMEDTNMPLAEAEDDPCTVDTDGDGTNDCDDGCPSDADKTAAGTCGCGVTDVDTDSDGTPDCNDGCPFNDELTAIGECGCQPCTDDGGDGGDGTDGGDTDDGPVDDGGDATDDDPSDDEVLGDMPNVPPVGGNGCGAAAVSQAMLMLTLVTIVGFRRRRG